MTRFKIEPTDALIVVDPVRPAVRADAAPRELPEGARMVANRLRKTLKASKSWPALTPPGATRSPSSATATTRICTNGCGT